MKAKDIKKFVLCLLAAVILTGGTACGNYNNADNKEGTVAEDSMKDDGVAGDAGEALKDGAETWETISKTVWKGQEIP